MSSQIQLVAILTPKPGSIEACIEALAPLAKYLEEHESGALKYEIYRQVNVESGDEDLVIIEQYKDQEALEIHRSSGPYKALKEKAAKEQLLAKTLDVKILQRVGGFGLRGGE